MRARAAGCAVVLCLCGAHAASAHGMRSLYLEVVELSPSTARVTLRAQVAVTGASVRVAPPCTLTRAGETAVGDISLLSCPETLIGAALTIDGLGPIVSEAVVYHAREGGTSESHLVTPEAPTWTVPPARTSSLAIAREYVGLGMRHIAGGADHLLFLLGLAFVFGLVHGLGFAGGLAEIGLPPRAIPAALIGFAGGVEIGQVAFLALALTAVGLLSGTRARNWCLGIGTYAVGGIGCCWLIARLHTLFWPS